MPSTKSDMEKAREALENAANHAEKAEDGEARARAYVMVADGYRKLHEVVER